MPPAARVTDPHICPAESPTPHVGGPILPAGSPTVLINFLPAARATDMVTCVGPPATILMGSAGVFINGLPAARMGDPTSHGGVIAAGSPNVIIGETGTGAPGTAGFGAIVPATVSPLAGMSCSQKMAESLAHASIGKGVLDALGGPTGIAALIVIAVGLQLVPIAGEVEDALLVLGAVIAGGNIIEGLKKLKQFHDLCCDAAKSKQDLIDASQVGADALATIGINGLLIMLSVLKAKKSATGPAARLPQDVAVDPKAPPALSTQRPIGSSPTQNAAMQADIQAARANGASDIRVNQQQVNAEGTRVGVNRPDLQYTDINGQRNYVEYDSDASNRGPIHEERILANDPSGIVTLKKVN